jgi:hypothetical protein
MPKKQKHYLLLLIILLLAFSRFLFPESDPAWWKSTDDIHDEAWWAENVRRMFAGEKWPGDVWARTWAVGPLTGCWHWLWFSLLGVSIQTLRLIALIPALASIFLLLKKNIPEIAPSLSYLPAFLFCVLPASWAMSRIGQIESMLSFIFLWIILLSYSNKNIIWFFLGLLLITGVLIKLSFIYFIPALYFWFLYRHIEIKKIALITGVILIGGLVSYFIYFQVNQELFTPFYTYFSSTYYTLEQLLDPRGWIIRLAWLPEKTFVTAPLSAIIISGILIRLGTGTLPSRKYGVFPLLLISLICLLLSDFSDRRLIILLVLLPLIWVQTHSRESGKWFRILCSWGLGLPLFSVYVGFFYNSTNPTLIDLISYIPFFILVYTCTLIITINILRIVKLNASLLLLRASIIIWILIAIKSSSYEIFHQTNWNIWLISMLQIILVGALIFLSWRKNAFEIQYVQLGSRVIIGMSLLFVIPLTVTPTYSLRNSNKRIKQLVLEKGNGIGPESLVELSITSNGFPLLYLDQRESVDKPNYHWFAGITTPTADIDSLNHLFMNNKKLLLPKTSFKSTIIPVLPSPIGFRESLVIWE